MYVICIALFLLIGYGVYLYMPMFWAAKAQNAFIADDFTKAIEMYKKSMATGRANVNVKVNYAYTLMRTGEYNDAEKLLDSVISGGGLKPDIKNAVILHRCMVYYKQGRIDEAMADANELYEKGYKNTQLYSLLGYLKLVKGEDVNSVTEFCEEAYEYNSDDRDIKDNLVVCYYNKGKYDRAEEMAEEIVRKYPKFADGCYHAAQIAIKKENVKRAKELLDNLNNCNWNNMTTVTREEADALLKECER